ncbi:leucine-rich repeat extensin-like protein 5 [Iris pallida]|uniref:Leucine-rich repeat extensin-like protein 5 n=1 Tax=Iris pallida TaxID=29817 RepID=A0AAX6HNL6_IRIPA|nr:leucine-rich repeat extensin-like protein 5 [Iris pallida]
MQEITDPSPANLAIAGEVPPSASPNREEKMVSSPETSRPPGWETFVPEPSPLPEMTLPSSPETARPPGWEDFYCEPHLLDKEKNMQPSPETSRPPGWESYNCEPLLPDKEETMQCSPETSRPPGWENFHCEPPLPDREVTMQSFPETSKPPLPDENIKNPNEHDPHNILDLSDMERTSGNSQTTSHSLVSENFGPEPITLPDTLHGHDRVDTKKAMKSTSEASPPPGWSSNPSEPRLPGENIETLHGHDAHDDTSSLNPGKGLERSLDNSPPPMSENLHQHQEPPLPEMGQMVCGYCRQLLSYPRGAMRVQCARCDIINFVLEAHQIGNVECGNCSLLLMYPYGAPSVKCSACAWVTRIGAHNICPPLSVQQGQPYPPPNPVH